MLAETRLSRHDFIAPLFVREGSGIRAEIPSMPGQYQHSVDTAMETIRRWADAGLSAVLLFAIPEVKDAQGSQAWNAQAAVGRLCGRIKADLPDIVVFTDVCLCEYTDHGHCGLVVEGPDGRKVIDNDATLELLGRTAQCHASCGADVVAPSAMMDGQVAAVRQALDSAGFGQTAIMSYAVKFASSLYGPFRDAAQSPPQFGDRKTYQMDFLAPRQATIEVRADMDEGADIVMVKPAGAYLDVISRVRTICDLPLAAYQVSGEYSMIKAAALAGWLDEKATVLELTGAIKRAGADLIISYFADQLVGWIGDGEGRAGAV